MHALCIDKFFSVQTAEDAEQQIENATCLRCIEGALETVVYFSVKHNAEKRVLLQ